jgi:hypothetical protein
MEDLQHPNISAVNAKIAELEIRLADLQARAVACARVSRGFPRIST